MVLSENRLPLNPLLNHHFPYSADHFESTSFPDTAIYGGFPIHGGTPKSSCSNYLPRNVPFIPFTFWDTLTVKNFKPPDVH